MRTITSLIIFLIAFCSVNAADVKVKKAFVQLKDGTIIDYNVSELEKIYFAEVSVLPTELDMINVVAGTFVMGSPVTELNRDLDEFQHQVSVSSFRMSRREISNAHFAVFLNENAARLERDDSTGEVVLKYDEVIAGVDCPAGTLILIESDKTSLDDIGVVWDSSSRSWVSVAGMDLSPAVYVTWFGASMFCSWAGGRLPTESEWEYVCRVGKSVEVSDYKATNEWGFEDMFGAVYEWCSDWYGTYKTTAQSNPTGVASGEYRVFRGGASAENQQIFCRPAFRFYNMPNATSPNVGFRIVLKP